MITDNIKKLSLFSNNNIPFKIWEVEDEIGQNDISSSSSKNHYNRIKKICINQDNVDTINKILYIIIVDSTDKEHKFFTNCTYFAEEYV